MNRTKIIRTSTISDSLSTFCKGLLRELCEKDGYDVVAVSSPGEHLREIAERESVRVVPVPMERRISPVKDLKSLWRLIRVFRREKPAMVHSMTPKAGLLSMLAAWVCRVPVRVHTFTGLVFPTATGLTQKILILTDRLTCACATHIVPEGEGVRNDLVSYRITGKPLKVLGHGNVRGSIWPITTAPPMSRRAPPGYGRRGCSLSSSWAASYATKASTSWWRPSLA